MSDLAELLDVPEWYDDAQCQGTSYHYFFATPTEDSKGPGRRTHSPRIQNMINTAKSICNVCKVREQCLTFAIETNQPHGIWGGMTKNERNRVRRRMVS